VILGDPPPAAREITIAPSLAKIYERILFGLLDALLVDVNPPIWNKVTKTLLGGRWDPGRVALLAHGAVDKTCTQVERSP
jgi:hypothetical protein